MEQDLLLKSRWQIPLDVPQNPSPERRMEDRKGTPLAATHSKKDDLVAEPGPDNWSSSMGTSFLPSVHHCWERGQGKGCRSGKYRLRDRSSPATPSGGADERSTPYSSPFSRGGEGEGGKKRRMPRNSGQGSGGGGFSPSPDVESKPGCPPWLLKERGGGRGKRPARPALHAGAPR